MATAPGRYLLGPQCGRVRARTFRTGLAQTAGHDLLLEFSQWDAEVVVAADGPSAVSARITADSLQVLEGTGGVKPLNDDNRRDIGKTARQLLKVDRHPDLVFESRQLPSGSIAGDPPINRAISGDLTVAGVSAPIALAVQTTAPGHFRITGTVVQSEHGIKPYSAFLGALKLRDGVDVEIEVDLPAPG